MTWRAAIYTRISRDDGSTGAGVARQEEDCRALCERNGYEVDYLLVDNDVSAYSGKRRPNYLRLLDLVGAGAVDVVVAYAPERLHRSPRELEDFIEMIERTGVKVETVRAGTWDLGSSHGRMVARMLGVVARGESERTGERVSRAHQQAKSLGFWRGPIPYGMRRTDRRGQPEPDPETADTVRAIASRVLAGEALTAIAKDLNRLEIPPRRGSAWTHTGVRRLMQSPAIGGLVRDGYELREAKFCGVLDEADWRAVQGAIDSRPPKESRRPREKLTLLGAILACGVHGSPLYGAGDRYARLYQSHQPGLCMTRIPRVPVDGLVADLVVERLSQPDARSVFVPPPTSGQEDEAALLRQRRTEILDLVEEGLIPMSEARQRLDRISAQLEEFERATAPSPITPAALRDPEQAWQNWTVVHRREVVRLLFRSITVSHSSSHNGPRADLSRVTVLWRGP